MKSFRSQDEHVKQFESENVYLQWLYRRHAMPMRLNQIMVRILWIAALVFWLFYFITGQIGWIGFIFLGISGSIVLCLPVLLTFLYLLYLAPLAIEADSKSSLMQFVFCSPVSTSEIVSNLRRFIIWQHLVMFFPTIFVVLLIISSGNNPLSSFLLSLINDPHDVFLIIAVPFLAWWFVLESGIASAGLPRIAYSSGLVFLLWIIPVLVAIFWGGYYVGKWHSYLWFVAYGVPHDFYSYDSPLSFLDETGWLMLHYDIFLLASGLITRRLSYRLMALKRSGYWGA